MQRIHGKAAGSDTWRGGIEVAQVMKHSFNGRKRKQSAGFKTANMAAFMYSGSRRKHKKRVKGK